MDRNESHRSKLPQISIEICAGKTEFPHRPMNRGRFLIGAGSNCDLQLGGDDIPMIHTLLVLDGDGLICESLVAEPALFVNDEAVRSVYLADEDSIRIGPFEFRVHIRNQAETSHAIAEPVNEIDIPESQENDDWVSQVLEDADVDDLVPEELEQLSAYELIELIEKDHEFIEEFESNIESGEETLTQAAAESHETIDELPSQEMLSQMTSLAQQLEERARELAEKEKNHANEAAALLDAQQRLSVQLEQIVKHLSELDETNDSPVVQPPSDRKIA